MKKSILAAALALACAACTTMLTVGPPQTITVGKTTLTVAGVEGYNGLAVQAVNPNEPDVFVPNNNIVVNEEPLRPVPSQGRVTIIWRLDADHQSPYSFPDDAIKIYPNETNPLPGDLDCGAVGERRKTFICTYRYEGSRRWKYSIRVKNTSGQDPSPLDPWIYQP